MQRDEWAATETLLTQSLMVLLLASAAFDCAVLLSLLQTVIHNKKALDVCGHRCRKIAAALGEIVCDNEPQGKAHGAYSQCCCQSSMPWDRRSQQGTKVSIAEANQQPYASYPQDEITVLQRVTDNKQQNNC